jgi:hypothetical protein
MSPQLRSVVAKVLKAHYRGQDDLKFVIGGLLKIAGEPEFETKLAVEAMRLAKKQLCEALRGPGTFSEWMQDPAKQAIAEQVALSVSYSNRRSSGRDPVPLLVEEDE